MFDGVIKRHLDPVLNTWGQSLSDRGLSANATTLIGLGFGLSAALAIAMGMSMMLGLVLFAVGRLADGLDGAIARARGKTDFGGYLDLFCDFVFYGAFPLAFALRDPGNGLAAAVLIASFYVNAASFLGFAVLAEKHGMTTRARGEKSLYFTAGLMEGSETIAFFVVMCFLPAQFGVLALIFAGLCLVTAVARVRLAYRVFSR